MVTQRAPFSRGGFVSVEKSLARRLDTRGTSACVIWRDRLVGGPQRQPHVWVTNASGRDDRRGRDLCQSALIRLIEHDGNSGDGHGGNLPRASGDVIPNSSGDNARRLGTKPTNRRKRKESETDELQQMWNFAVLCGAQSVTVEVLPGP